MILILLIALAAATAYTIETLAPTVWEVDLLTFATPPIAAALLVLIVLAAIRQRPTIALVLVAGLIGSAIVTASPGNTGSGEPRPLVRVMTFNVLLSNTDTAEFRAYVESVQPDVIILQEVRPSWAKLRTWEAYPYSDLGGSGDVMVLSRLPFTAPPKNVYDFSNGSIDGLKAIRMEVSVAGRPGAEAVGGALVVYGLHAPTPRIEPWWRQRNAFLTAIGDLVAAEPADKTVVVGGDWNTPIWSPFFRGFLDKTGLQVTSSWIWPAATRYFRELDMPTFVGAAVDHIVVSPKLVALRHAVGPDLGSDHLPVTVDLAVR
ncbi:endonuclease/exonuclease/phosphatase family protein [Chthonobacter albigriseus]|uniref:endonuclease/exonuclease/phosphatase family protein n=1 Tax=Chthonobacter albigriseus TaxID=1683161 RepID=UPI0015EFA50D|nr:endonuclease/exonuclease/phosphatase family protein [Chthonobacter albigriseus]